MGRLGGRSPRAVRGAALSFRRGRFADLVQRQLRLFAEDEAALLREATEAEAAYDAAERDEAEELYGDYLLVCEAGTEALAALRDTYAATLEENVAGEYRDAFDRAAVKRFPHFALGL